MSKKAVLLEQILKILNDNQAIDVVVIYVTEQTSITDYMIICSGRANRHVKSLGEQVIEQMKSSGLNVISRHGFEMGEWVLVDFGDFVLHLMLPETRAFYNLEELWKS